MYVYHLYMYIINMYICIYVYMYICIYVYMYIIYMRVYAGYISVYYILTYHLIPLVKNPYT